MIESAAVLLHRLAVANTLSHAYLLVHPDTERLFAEAVLTVQVLVCENVTEQGHPCQECVPCIAVKTGNHPAVNWISPDGASLKISQMRTAVRLDRRMSSWTNRNFIVLERVDTMTVEAASAILKWVEEPAGDRLFLLLAVSQTAVLPTLRSRCTILPLSQDPIEGTSSSLASFFGFRDNAERFEQIKTAVQQLGQRLATKDPSVWHFPSDNLVKWSDTQDFSLFVDLLVAYCRDAVATSYGLKTLVFEQTNDFTVQSRLLEPQAWTALAMLFSGMTKRLKAHVNAVSALESLLLQAIDTLGFSGW